MIKLAHHHIENILALTPLQEGMLFHYLQAPQSRLYCEQLSLEISGEIDPILFEKAWNIVTKTNEMLRTVFRWEKVEKPSQIILKKHLCRVIFHDLSGMDNDHSQKVLQELKEQDLNEGFDLQEVPFRVTLIKLAEKKFVMLISYHHILYDGWSNGILLKEFFKNYELCRHGKTVKIPLKTPFKDFVKWQQSQDKSQQKKFWHNYLAGIETITEIPIKNKPEKSTAIQEYSLVLSENTCKQLEVFSKEHRVTLAAVFYAAWGILLQKYCNSEDIVFGTTISGRSASIKQIENMVGLFINTLPLRIQFTPNTKLIDVIAAVENHLQAREAVESTPLVDIQGILDILGRDVARNVSTLFDTIMVIENYPLDNRLIPPDGSLNIQSYAMAESTHYDLTIAIMMFDQMEIKFSFKEALFAPEIIENLAGHFKNIIEIIIEDAEIKAAELEIITIAEKNRLLYEFNDTAADYPKNKTIHQLFEEQAAQTPDYIALHGCMDAAMHDCMDAAMHDCMDAWMHGEVARNVSLTYHQLNEQANRLAGVLIEKGVLPDDIIAIKMERSIEMIIGILGILKSGGAYLPIDPGYPQERIDYILKDSNARILITNNEKKTDNCQCSIVNCQLSTGDRPRSGLHHSAFITQHSNHLCYIIYTSGTTGKPKGVMVNHGGLTNVLHWRKLAYGLGINDRILHLFSSAFDAFVTGTFTPIISGSSVCMLSAQEAMDLFAVKKAIVSMGITHFISVPSIYRSLLELCLPGDLANLREITLGGEALDDVLLARSRELNPRLKV
ncbi:MAG: condensation domain-containing protein, partial [Acidobacteria bacterium]|nr:condensation domain-containing protein [Acidobacteriota bacterium]